jgi:putative transposase
VNRVAHSVTTLCRLLAVSPSGYYAWRQRPTSARARQDAALTERILALHGQSRGTYGVPRIHADLAAEGWRVGRKRVARLMRSAGLRGVSRRRFAVTTQSDQRVRPAPDRVDRSFTADAPDQLYVGDITYIPTWEGFLYLATILDVFSRRVVGWAMAEHLRTELVLDALEMALEQRRPEAVIHHSDQGCQYTSVAFTERCREAGVAVSMGSVGDCYDNAMAESFFATLECEVIQQSRFRSRVEARQAVFSFIEGWYNTRRRHSALGYQSPRQFEAEYHQSHKPEPVH